MSKHILILGALCLTLSGCTGARGSLRFDQLDYPVSSSGYLYTPEAITEVVVVDQMYLSVNLWGIGWSLIPLNGKVDVSDLINYRISAAGGEGIINLSITTDNCGINYVWPLNMLPVWPGCVAVGIQGDIVRGVGLSDASEEIHTVDEVVEVLLAAVSEHGTGPSR